MAAGKALASGKTSTSEYEFEAYVVKKDGTNYFLAAMKRAF